MPTAAGPAPAVLEGVPIAKMMDLQVTRRVVEVVAVVVVAVVVAALRQHDIGTAVAAVVAKV